MKNKQQIEQLLDMSKMPNYKMSKTPISISDIATNKILSLLANRTVPTEGIRIKINTKGCSGLSYSFEYADQITPNDEVVKFDRITILIDKKAMLFLIGTVIDYQESVISSGFKFINPNEKGRCGCGQSFRV